MNDYSSLEEFLADQEQAAPAKTGPPPDALSRISKALGAGANPVVSITRYGTHEDASLVVQLASGAQVRFERQAEAFVPDVVVRRASLVGLTPKMLTKPQTTALAQAMIAIARLAAEADAREEARSLTYGFLHRAIGACLAQGDLRDPAERYRLFLRVRNWQPSPDGFVPAAERSIVLQDEATGDRYVRVEDFGAHVRESRGRSTAWALIHSMVIECGWEHVGELQQREPGAGRGGGKARINAYRVPPGWEDGDDGDEVEEAPS